MLETLGDSNAIQRGGRSTTEEGNEIVREILDRIRPAQTPHRMRSANQPPATVRLHLPASRKNHPKSSYSCRRRLGNRLPEPPPIERVQGCHGLKFLRD